MNIGRMAPGSQDYSLNTVAHGVEDYYLGKGESPGRWLGRGFEPLGLDGHVNAGQLNAVLAGQDPATGELLARHPARKVPGFDLTFRAPTSVSLLWALGDEQIAARVQAAHDAAVDAAVGYLERDAGRTRRGAQGAERVGIDGFVAAGFRHRTSRAGDPLLHTHVLVANLARTSDDGVWRTLDSRALFAHARTAGFLYQAHLRHELTRTLGVAWEPVVNGTADLAGVDRGWIDAFSQRRRAIVAELDTRGETSAKAAQVATLSTRQAKHVQADEPTLRQQWRTRADDLGIDPRVWARLLDQQAVGDVDLRGLFDDLVGPDGLTAHASTFDRRDMLRAIAERLPDGSDIATIEQIADRPWTTPSCSAPTSSTANGATSHCPAAGSPTGSTCTNTPPNSKVARTPANPTPTRSTSPPPDSAAAAPTTPSPPNSPRGGATSPPSSPPPVAKLGSTPGPRGGDPAARRRAREGPRNHLWPAFPLARGVYRRVVREGGVEPPPPKGHGPEPCASACSATRA